MARHLGATRAAFLAAHETRFATVEGRLTSLTWMVGTNIALTLAIVGKLFLTF